MDISKLKIYDYIFIVAFCVIAIFGSGVIASLGREGIGIAKNGVILRDYVLFVPLLVLNLSARLLMAKFEKFGAVFGALFALNLAMFICSFYF